MIGSSIVSSHEDGLDKLARHARVVLIILAALQFASAAFLWVADPQTRGETLGGMLFVGALFAVFAVWARQQPLPAVLTGLGVYLAGVGAAAAVEPATLTQGLAFKAIVAVMFYNGISAALTYRAMARMKPAAVVTPVVPAGTGSAAVVPRRRGRRGPASG
jgi:hypothetical protein